MKNKFSIGQRVVCVNDQPINYKERPPLRVGAIYTIIEVEVNADSGVRLAEVRSLVAPNEAFLSERFEAT